MKDRKHETNPWLDPKPKVAGAAVDRSEEKTDRSENTQVGAGPVVVPSAPHASLPQPQVHAQVSAQAPSILRVVDDAKPQVNPKISLKYLVKALIKYNASDLHIRGGRPPLYRINGQLIAAKMPELSNEQVYYLLNAVLNDQHREKLRRDQQVDLSIGIDELGRFRCNVYYQRGSLSAAIRMIPTAIPRFETLGVPAILSELCRRPRGLILITGATGAGKSTTLAALIQQLNETSNLHILSIEDPIEFLHRDHRSMITQREVGTDIKNMTEALHAGLRQDPDVIVIGEMRDPETIQIALTAAETGHLVLSTLHTNDACSTIGRILDVFPPNARDAIRAQLSTGLLSIVSQHLIPRIDGKGRVPVCEVLINSPSIESYILKDELDKIPDAIANSNNYYKMQSMNQALERLIAEGIVSQEAALKASSNPEDLRLRLSGMIREEGYQQPSS